MFGASLTQKSGASNCIFILFFLMKEESLKRKANILENILIYRNKVVMFGYFSPLNFGVWSKGEANDQASCWCARWLYISNSRQRLHFWLIPASPPHSRGFNPFFSPPRRLSDRRLPISSPTWPRRRLAIDSPPSRKSPGTNWASVRKGHGKDGRARPIATLERDQSPRSALNSRPPLGQTKWVIVLPLLLL